MLKSNGFCFQTQLKRSEKKTNNLNEQKQIKACSENHLMFENKLPVKKQSQNEIITDLKMLHHIADEISFYY